MASIGTESGGRRRILFVARDGSRRTVRLGKCSQRDAEQVCRHVEALAAATIHGQPVSRETAVWLAGIGAQLHDRLARAGLVSPREQATVPTVAGFVDGYIAQRLDLKPATRVVLQQARLGLVRYLGDHRPIDKVTPADADGYRADLIRNGLAPATIAKQCRYARHYFEVAKRHGILSANPFAHIKGAVKGNPGRRAFVPGEVVARVMAAAPDPQWKLLIALARWGGLRVPSEALALTWQDVDFEQRRFIVRAPKTAHHKDGGVRVVPMFPELVEHFHRVFDDAEVGAVQVITRYGPGVANLGTQLRRYIEQAGIAPWPKSWQNLRASRATELADSYPSHVCAAWLGHTEAVADAFYRIVTDAHFERAVSAAQNPAQQGAARRRTGRQAEAVHAEKTRELQGSATGCDPVRNGPMGDIGLEPTTSRV